MGAFYKSEVPGPGVLANTLAFMRHTAGNPINRFGDSAAASCRVPILFDDAGVGME